jgi:hypothetical protein
MLPAFLVALTWVPAILGLGALVRHRGDAALRPGLAGFFGLGAAGAIATAINFALPVSSGVSAAIWVLGAVLFVLRRRWLFEEWQHRDGLGLALLLAAACRLMRQPLFHYDTGLYHLQSLKWITETSIQPGIANIHYRLGFNSLWTAAAAALEHPLASGRSPFFLNQLPILFAGQPALVALRRLVRGDRSFANLMLAGAVLPMASATFGLGGLYVDYTASIVVYLALAMWARAWSAGEGFADEATPAALLSVLAALLKLSAAPVAAVALVLLVARRRALNARWWMRMAVPTAVAVLPWLARGTLLSGCFAFPERMTCIDALPWAVPEAKTRSVAAWVQAWARNPGSLAGGGWEWLREWPDRILRDYPEAHLLLGAAGLGVVLCAVRRRRWPREAVCVLLAALACAIYWFVSAPEPRFALGVLFALSLAPVLAALAGSGKLLEGRAARGLVAATLLVTSVGLVIALDGHERTGMRYHLAAWTPPPAEWPETPIAYVKPRTTASGVPVLVPDGGESCGASPIPCTPDQEFDPSLAFDGYFHVRR